MSYIHGHSPKVGGWSPEYNSWVGMKARCNNPKQEKYKYYGGKGISYDQNWENFENFLRDMGQRPKGTTLSRLDPNKNYCKENCAWETYTQQNLRLGLRSDNTSGRKGVSYKKQINRWIARSQHNYKEILLYCGSSFDLACEAREKWETEMGGL